MPTVVQRTFGSDFSVAGQIRTKVEEMQAGDIGAAVKLKDVRTGDTLNAKGADNRFDFIKYPEPRYRRAIKPLNEANAEKLNEALIRMHEEDPRGFRKYRRIEANHCFGTRQFHLKTLKWRLENNDKIEVEFLEPKIPIVKQSPKQLVPITVTKSNQEEPDSLRSSSHRGALFRRHADAGRI